MADTLTTTTTVSTVPNGTVIATDDAGAGGHVQIVKLAISTDGSATALTANNTDGLLVNLGSNNDVTVTGAVAVTQSGTWDEVGINDSGNSITVDGTVAATQSGAWNVTNVSGTVSLPTGASTLAEQQSQTTHLATIAGDTTDIETAVELIDDTVATLGTSTYSEATTKGLIVGAVRRDADTTLVDTTNEIGPLQMNAAGQLKVEVFSGEALPVTLTSTTVTGTVAVTQSGTWDEVGINDSGNSITVDNGGTFATQATLQTGDNVAGRVKLTDGTDVADILDLTNSNPLTVAIVDGSGDQITSFGGGTQYTEDAAAAANPVGTVPILIRKDTPGTEVSADGDNVAQRGTNYGAAYVTLLDTGGTPVSVGGGTQYTEDAAAAANPIGNALMLVREDARGGSLVSADGDNVAARGNNKGELYVKTTDSDALLTTIDADTSALAGTVGGSELQVDIVSAPTLTVNAHAVTNAGTFAVQVDGAALTALQLIDDAVYAEDVAAQAADKGLAVLAVRRDADTSLVGADNDYANLQVDANGYLKVEIFDGGGSHTVDNAGTFAVQVDGNALTALQLIDNPVIVDDNAFTPATSSVSMAGFEADETATDSVDEGDAGAARMTLDRKVIVTPQPHTAGGLSIFRSIDLDEGTLEVVKNAPGCVYGMWVTNTATSTRWIKFYDATSGTAGTGTPVITWGIPGNSSDDIGGLTASTHGIMFTTGICVGAVTGVADNDTGAPGANEVIINVFYK